MADPSTVRELLASTSVPGDLVDEVLEAGPSWLMGADTEVVAAEAVLCHPPLAPSEVRAVAAPAGGGVWRLTVVAADRPGLLSGTAGVLAGEGASVSDATTTVLERSGLALQRIEVVGRGLDAAAWERIGARLRVVLGEPGGVALGAAAWRPTPPVTVETQPQGDARCVVTLRAPDRTGLLHAAASWLTANGCNVVACHASAEGGRAVDVFVIEGDLDPAAFAEALGGGSARRAYGPLRPLRVATGLALLPWRVGAAVGRAVADGLPEAQ